MLEKAYAERFPILPRPKRVVPEEGYFIFQKLRVFTVGEGDRFVRALKVLAPSLRIEAATREDADVVLSVAAVFSAKNEFCAIRIRKNGIEIRCRDNAGARNAAAILFQILQENENGWCLPCGTVEDYPDASYRSMMLESSGRCWLSMERIYLYLRQMALARMNVMQFHFMEGPGCTIQLDCYPDWQGYGAENLKYTKDEIRAMITYADELGIGVTPFVEVISHSQTFNKIADIACPGDTDEHMFAVCVGQEKTYEAIERVLAEVAALFPDPVLHIGADEYDMSAVAPLTVHWDQCPHCRALSEKMGYTTYRELFMYAIERVNRIVNRIGKVAMMWNADIKPGKVPADFPRNIVMHYYRCDNILGKEKHFDLWPNGYVEDGFAVLNSHHHQTYMDLAKYMNTEKLNNWSYLTDPGTAPENRASVIGGCCCAWEDYPHFERTVPPAIFLFADRLHNAESAPVPYDAAYGRLLTHAVFEGKLPAVLNVFEAVGDVLPPLTNNTFHANRMVAKEDVLLSIQNELNALKERTGDSSLARLAEVYAHIAADAIAHVKTQVNAGPLKKTVEFDG